MTSTAAAQFAIFALVLAGESLGLKPLS